jgi:hypothetical protein
MFLRVNKGHDHRGLFPMTAKNLASAQGTIQGVEMMNMIRKGQVRWLSKGDIAGQVVLVAGLLGLTAFV